MRYTIQILVTAFLSVVLVITVGLWFASQASQTAELNVQDGDISLSFVSDTGWVFLPSQCVEASWNAQNIRSIYLNGEGTVGEGTQTLCLDQAYPTLKIEDMTGSGHFFLLPVSIGLYDPRFTLFISIAAALAAAWLMVGLRAAPKTAALLKKKSAQNWLFVFWLLAVLYMVILYIPAVTQYRDYGPQVIEETAEDGSTIFIQTSANYAKPGVSVFVAWGLPNIERAEINGQWIHYDEPAIFERKIPTIDGYDTRAYEVDRFQPGIMVTVKNQNDYWRFPLTTNWSPLFTLGHVLLAGIVATLLLIMVIDSRSEQPLPIKRVRAASLLAIILLFLFAVVTGCYGLDFGFHWDEGNHTNVLLDTLTNGNILWDFYHYPSLIEWLTHLPMVDNIIRAILDPTTTVADLQSLVDHDYLLSVRYIFVVITSATALIVAWTLWFWKRSAPLAVIGAALMALSWEIAYHARWIAPDTILMFFTASTTALLLWQLKKPQKQNLIWWAAVMAGAGTATKYPGGILLLSLLIAGCQLTYKQGWRKILVKNAGLIIVFGLTYLIITPGTLLTFEEFKRDVVIELTHYGEGHGRYTVSFSEHIGVTLTYLSTVLFSPVRIPAAILFSFSLVGIYDIIRRERHLIGILLVVPVIYGLYISSQSVAFIRNLILLTPFLALWISSGIYTVYQRLPQRFLRYTLAAVLVGIFAVNAVLMINRAQSIMQRDHHNWWQDVETFIVNHPDTTFYLSEAALASGPTTNWLAHDNITIDPAADYDQGIFSLDDVVKVLPSNQPNIITKVFGPYEVNLDYYSGWKGDDRLLLIDHAVTLDFQAD